MKHTVEFKCGKCGLLTPAIADIPDDTPDGQKLRLIAECFYCGTELTRDETAFWVRRQDKKGKR